MFDSLLGAVRIGKARVRNVEGETGGKQKPYKRGYAIAILVAAAGLISDELDSRGTRPSAIVDSSS